MARDPSIDWSDPGISPRCWETIFYYAASNISATAIQSGWLVHAATSCKMLSDPAISALYRCPSITNAAKAKKLALVLQKSPSETMFNYRVKIEELQIDISFTTPTILAQLIAPARRLQDLTIFTTLDQPPYRQLNLPSRWRYSALLFEALLPSAPGTELGEEKVYPTRLTSWEWSGRFIGGHVPDLESISDIHKLPSFSHLTRLGFTNFQLPSLYARRKKQPSEAFEAELLEQDLSVINSIAKSINSLQQLRCLSFESSTVMNTQLLSRLPKSLSQLNLVNCWEVTSSDLLDFLASSGSKLRSLTLHHNQSLNLAFLTQLKTHCPGLRELNMNLSYYKLHDSINDSDPIYDDALLVDQVPSWPTSLRVLIIENVRKWDLDTAEMFLTSLLDSARELLDLRVLSIKTMLDIPWQRRATLRTSWKEQMDEVFLRRVELPVGTTSTYPTSTNSDVSNVLSTKTPEAALPVRKSNRPVLIGSGDDLKAANRRIGATSRSYRSVYKDLDTATDDDTVSDSSEAQVSVEGNSQMSQHIQGMCKVVNILFDNQKVRELQYGMEDFRSEDDTDDEEDWEGDCDYDEDDPVIQF